MIIGSIFRIFIVPALLAGFGSVLAYAWQSRAWRIQQKQASATRDYENLHALWEKISQNSSTRLFASRRFLSAFEAGSTVSREDARTAYSISTAKWNEELFSIYNQTTVLLGWNYTKRIEDRLHYPFVLAGRKITDLARNYPLGPAPWDKIATIGAELQAIQTSLSSIMGLILREVEARRSVISDGKALRYNRRDLPEMSSWQLVKLLFVPSIEEVNIKAPL